MASPISKLDLMVGYAAAFALVAVAQALITSGVAFLALGLDIDGPAYGVILLAIANAVLGMALGLFFSAFATTEFQAVLFMPVVVFPQLLLCGLFVAREQMAPVLEVVSYALPLTYAYDGLARVASGDFGSRGALDAVVIVGVTVLALVVGSMTLHRRTP